MKNLKKQILAFLRQNPDRSYKTKEIAKKIKIDSDHYAELRKILKDLQASGEISRFRKQKFGLHKKENLITGDIHITKHGYGFVHDEKTGEEIYIAKHCLKTALDGDSVEIELLAGSKGKSREGEVVRVLARSKNEIVGTYQKNKYFGFVIPDDEKFPRDVYIPEELSSSAKEGQKVVVKIDKWDSEHLNPEGKIIEILGFPDEKGVDVLSVAKSHQLPLKFSEAIEKEAHKFPKKIPATEYENRLDLRKEICFTIDPVDAKDFDDAVSLKILENRNYLLGVHIADVSHYVKEGSTIDIEAFNRGTSVYLVDRVIPMLPERLSNDLCSLKPDEDRLTYSIMMEINSKNTQIINYEIKKSVIRSKKRFTYEEVQEILDSLKDDSEKVQFHHKPHTIELSVRDKDKKGQLFLFPASTKGGEETYNIEKSKKGKKILLYGMANSATKITDEVVKTLVEMHKLSQKLLQKRLKEGSLDFDTPEVRFQFDENGFPIAVHPKARLDSHRLIEEFMLLANKTVAKHIGFTKKSEKSVPFVYRIHEPPDHEKLQNFSNFVKALGHNFNVQGKITPKKYQKFLESIKGVKEKNIIEDIAIRSMMKAVYSPKNVGHFGLAFKYYTHFTSPIRRYPDLIVHRLLNEYSNGSTSSKRIKELEKRLSSICSKSSEMERKAMEAERDSVKMKQAEYITRHIGETFKGIISGVTSYGLYVQLPDTLIEGLVHIRNIGDDYYIYDEKKYALIGRRYGETYRLGDEVRIRVIGADKEEGYIDFVIVEV